MTSHPVKGQGFVSTELTGKLTEKRKDSNQCKRSCGYRSRSRKELSLHTSPTLTLQYDSGIKSERKSKVALKVFILPWT